MLWLRFATIFTDIMYKNQISPQYRYIEKLPNIKLDGKITDTKWMTLIASSVLVSN